MASVAVGVVGAGVIGRAHVRAILATEGATLAGIADPTEAGKALAEAHGTPWFADHASLLEAGGLDAAIIATPNEMHRPMAVDFIGRGVPVVVEKPIASTVADGEAIAAASAAAGVPVLVGHHRRHNPIVRRARALIAEGRLGRLTSASILYTFFKPPDYFEVDWRRRRGGGPVLINLIHEIDLVRHLCGEIAEVQAIVSNAVRGFEVEDSAAILLRLADGALVTINLCDTAVTPWSWDLAAGESPLYPPQPARVQTHFLSGTEGSLTLPTLECWSYRGDRSWFAPLTREEVALVRGDPYIEQIRHLCRVVRGEEAPLITAADGSRTLRATLAVLEAARRKAAVTIDPG